MSTPQMVPIGTVTLTNASYSPSFGGLNYEDYCLVVDTLIDKVNVLRIHSSGSCQSEERERLLAILRNAGVELYEK